MGGGITEYCRFAVTQIPGQDQGRWDDVYDWERRVGKEQPRRIIRRTGIDFDEDSLGHDHQIRQRTKQVNMVNLGQENQGGSIDHPSFRHRRCFPLRGSDRWP
jgi:hypothetical protein